MYGYKNADNDHEYYDRCKYAHKPPKNTSSQDAPSSELQATEIKVAEAEKQNALASRTLNLSLLAYVIVTAILAAATFWGSRTTERLRAAEKLLNDLQKEKIRSDSIRKTEVETQKVRGEAIAQIERARGDAETKIVEAKTDAAERIGQVQKEVAEQQERAAKQEERAAKAENVLLELQDRARSRRFWSEKIELVIKEKRPTGDVLVTYDASVPDAPNVWFDIYRTLERAGWNVTTRARNATDPLRGTDGVSIFAWKLDMCPSNPDTTLCVLWDLFCASSLKDWNCGLGPQLPKNSFRIEVLARPLMPPLVPIGTL